MSFEDRYSIGIQSYEGELFREYLVNCAGELYSGDFEEQFDFLIRVNFVI